MVIEYFEELIRGGEADFGGVATVPDEVAKREELFKE
jgi:hypothetical protein